MKRLLIFILTVCAAFALSSCGGGSSSGPSSTTYTLTGQVAISEVDSSLAVPLNNSAVGNPSMIRFFTKANTPAAGFNVTLYKIKGDGTEEAAPGVTATTDSSGNYTLSNVPAVTVGTGAATDFYYEVRAASDTLEVKAPAAPTADDTVNLSPETTLAAKMLTDVASIPGQDTVRPPMADMIENTREMVAVDVEDLSAKSDVTLSVSTDTTTAENQLKSARALTTASGNSDWMIKAYEAESEAIQIKNEGTADDAMRYLERVTVVACNFNQELVIPRPVTDVLADEFLAETKHTPSAVVEAYNANNGGDPDITVEGAVAEFGDVLSAVDDAIAAKSELTASDSIGLLTERDLTGASFSATTEMEADQVVAFVQKIFPSECNPGTANVMGLFADLTGVGDLDDAQIYETKVYNTSGGLQGGFVASARVYAPSLTVTGMTISGSDIGTLTMANTGGGDFWETTGTNLVDYTTTPITYTFTATLSDSSTLVSTVSRAHPNVVEPEATFADGTAISDNKLAPSLTTVARPVFVWSSATTLGDDQYLRYTYEFAFIDVTDDPEGPLSECPGVETGEKRLYDVTGFMPTVDCDINACATLSGRDVSDIVCRIYIQAYVVDSFDQWVGTSAGEFKVFCSDLDGNGDCG